MVKLTRYERLQKEHNAKTFKPFLDELTQCSLETFVDKLNEIQDWDRSRDDIFVWIPVLNRIDDTLSKIVEKYSYKTDDHIKKPVRLIMMSQGDENICVNLIQFTHRLLYNSENRFIYSSMDVMNNLLNCPNFKVKLAAIKVLAIMGERYIIARERFDAENVLGNHFLKKKALNLALALPSSTMDDEGKHFSLVDLFFVKKKYPAKWTKLKYNYYTSVNVLKSNANSILIQNKEAISQTPSMKKLLIPIDELRNSTLQQLFDKGMELLPSENWFDFSLKVTINKAFSDDSFENIELRNLIIRTKYNAIALVNTIYIPPQVSSKLFEIDPYAFNNLTDFISLSEKKIPKDIRTDSLFALECISLKHVWCSDIVRNLGGNMSHGLMFQILHYISKILRENSSEVDEEYNVRFFYLISNLADVKSLHTSLLSAGLIQSLIDIVSVKQTNFRRTMASANHLLELLINDSESTSEFINNDGFNILINSVKEEVDFALEHPEYGNPPKFSTVYYSVSFRQLAYIRSLLKIVLKLLKTDSGDRIRNLIDSPILVSLKKILENRPVFGYTLITHSLDIIQRVINSEPTIYPVLVEAGLIPYIIDHFSEFISPYAELLAILPDILSALCLNTEGLKKVKETNMIPCLFQAISDPKYARILSWKEEATDLGSSLDELARHYPDLRPIILESFCTVVKELPKRVSFKQPFLYNSTIGLEYFYKSKTEDIQETEEGANELEFWDVQESTPLVDCFADLLYGMTLENFALGSLPENLKFEDILSIIVMDRPPFDYTSSQTMLNFTDVLQMLDENHKGYAFPVLFKELETRLGSIESFLYSPSDESFLLQAKIGRDNSDVEETLAKLSHITTLLYLITDVYVNVTSLSPARVLQIMEYFEKNSMGLIEKLRFLFQKCALEDMFVRNLLPDEVITQTMPEQMGHAPPIQIHVSPPSRSKQRDNYTSSKHKNTIEIRALLNKIQACTSILFKCFLRLTHFKNMQLETSDTAIEVHIFDEVVKQTIDMIRVVNLDKNLPFCLVILNFNTYIFSFPKGAINGAGILQTVPIYLFYQKGGYKLYADLTKKLFLKMSKCTDIPAVEEINYLKNTNEVLTLSCLINTLSFFNKSMQVETMESIRSMESFYPFLQKDYNMTTSMVILIRIMALGMVFDLNKDMLLFDGSDRAVPYAVFKQALTLLKNAFSGFGYDDVFIKDEEITILQLHWDLIPPSNRKIEFLKTCGLSEDFAKGYLEENKNELPVDEKPDIFSADEWSKYNENKINHMDEMFPIQIESQYKNMSSIKDLEVMKREFIDCNFPQKIFEILRFYPKLVNAFAKTLLQVFSDNNEPVEDFAGKVLGKILETNPADSATMSSLIHLFGIFLNEKYVYEKSNLLIGSFLEYLEKSLLPAHVNSLWFSKALYVFEIILAKSEVPVVDKLGEGTFVGHLPSLYPVYHIDKDIKQKIFDILIRVKEVTNFYSALATSRILILYARHSTFSDDIVSSGILSEILKAIGVNQKSEKINYLESSFLLLLRRCFETKDIVDNLIKYELSKSFTSRSIGESKEKVRGLNEIIEEKAHVVMRNPEAFGSILCSTTRFTEFEEDGLLSSLIMKRDPEKLSVSEGVSTTNKPRKRTGIIHFLLSQLMAASRKDWLSEPTTKTNDADNIKNSERVEPSKNPVCAYMMFLLKVLVELLSSYKQCKFEFLTFDRRNSYTEFPKPRSTAINFFLYQLLDKVPSPEQNKYEGKRREAISMLARSVLVGFIATVQDSNIKASDPKVVDPDMNFIRRCTVESIIKALKNNTTTSKVLESNVSKLETWFKIISSMVFIQAPYLRLILDSNKVDADQYQMCKLMIEMNIPTAISECVANLDINYPFAKKLFNNAVDPLNAINSVRNSFSELFKIEMNEDEDVVEDESEKEDVPNMFKNSSLGMYDVEDIEEEDDDSLIGDDEDIAFVEGEDGGYDVVFSDEDDEVDDDVDNDILSDGECSSFGNGSDSASDIVYDIDPDTGLTVEIDSDGQYGTNSDSDLQSISEGDDRFYSHIGNDGIEIISLDEEEYDSNLDIDLSDYDVDESDWESGLSELSTSDEQDSDSENNEGNDSDNSGFNRMNGTQRRWVTSDGVDIMETPSDNEEPTGIFQGIQHVFQSEDQPLFRVQSGRNAHRHHQSSFHRNFGHSTLGPPSLTLLNVGRHHQSNLINPLGPSGLEEIENDISDQLTSVGSGIHPRTGRPNFAGMLFAGEPFDERTSDGIVLKPTVARWKDIFDMFYDNKGYAKNIIPKLINNVYDITMKEVEAAGNPGIKELSEEIQDHRREADSDADIIDSDELGLSTDEGSSDEGNVTPSSDQNINGSENENENQNQNQTDEMDQGETIREDREPIFVIIDDAEVDIAGTDIDPEFLNALPEEMRGEVFMQHVRERRAEALYHDINSREIDSAFLDAIPDDMRVEILEQEALDSRIPNMNIATNNDTRSNEDMESDSRNRNLQNITIHEPTSSQPESTHVETNDDLVENEKKKSSRIYFSPLIDRAGVAALMKSIFISQPYIQREMYHELFYRLCSSKQNRSDIINMLLIILTEGVIDQHSLEKVYMLINNKVHGVQNKYPSSSTFARQLPPDCSPLVVANQAIEILQNLIEADNKLKFFFITEHENLLVSKSPVKNKRDIFSKNMKWPIKHLFALLDRKIITDETVLMDLLTRILQVCTKPLHSLIKSKEDKNGLKKKFQIPYFESKEFEQVISIIKLESCNTKVFQQTLNTMFNLLVVKDAMNIFTQELILLAREISDALILDLNKLTDEQATVINGNEINSELIQKFTVPSSNQAKLLKVLTAVDFLYTHKKKQEDVKVSDLMSLYAKMNLGKLWSSLSNCLTELEDKKGFSTSATILLPLMESLMVVYKHCNNLQDNVKATSFKHKENKKIDFTELAPENLFFPFTDLHKKLLNHMIRSNPKLMSGPFALLVKNPKILDFDNKRYYFVAKLRPDSQDHPKLGVTVRRDQVFLDSYRSLFFKSNEEIKKSKLEITFKGESGVDAGGLTREWYQVLSRQMFNPDYALFIPVEFDKTTFRPNCTSSINPEHCSFFKFIGMIIGRAIRDQCYLDCHFSREVYKNILGKPVALKDMESLDLEYHKSLIWILENDITDIIEETFSVETDDYGEHKVIDLIENGHDIAVTESNKQEYVQKIVEYKLQTSVKEQMSNFLQGFYSLIPKELISIFDEQELELLISGLPDIDVDDWKNNSTYVNYTASCKQINYFWRAVKSFDSEERVKLLQFVTGTSKVPLNGFKELAGVNGFCKFSIHKDYGPVDRLPSSHTCFNQLDLPAYNSYETLRGSLLLAINEGYEGFGIA